jgi:hydrogenase maturation protease
MSILLIGTGNEYRCDDGAGLSAIRVLKARGLPDALAIESPSDGAELMELWKFAAKVILIDAVSSGAESGTIYRFDAHAQPIPASLSFLSTHAFGLAEAIELARALHLLPQYLVVYAIEGQNFTIGTGLSQDVEKAVQEVVEQVTREVQALSLLQERSMKRLGNNS